MLVDAVKRHVDGATKPIAELVTKVDGLVAVNHEQLTMMQETAKYRGIREEQERSAAQKKSDELLELEKQKAASADAIGKLAARNTRWQIIAGVVTAIAVAIIGALIASHK